ncbi:uncharacterized protein BXZ73DRAFT_89555 [Epithele typhae]|uniref:uncharacterized protein n=1 Tax=Epithele typhae TaxID=378194 RepID=UPI00200816AB|nr:uncharacterized protein BXZ73DRAFT_89555 [Epithele typhae]KAH9935225.1 hypothetical protein BXZ73DRAFT_89555 [Epithele typhae]
MLQDLRDFTEEPFSMPPSPANPVHLAAQTPSVQAPSRRTTAPHTPGYYDGGYPPYQNQIYPLSNGGGPGQIQSHKWTQEDQDQYDERVRKKALNELVESWMDRLQLISLITTFFAGMESQLIGSTVPDNPGSDPRINQAANAALVGALVIHTSAAIISFLAAFFLIRFKLSVAKREERRAEGLNSTTTSSVQSNNWYLEQTGPLRRGAAPTHLLDFCHSLCMWLSAIGFILALAGIVCFAWSRLSTNAAVFASVCTAGCVVSGVVAMLWPASGPHLKPKAS